MHNPRKHWQIEVTDGIVCLGFDLADRSTNVLNKSALLELDEIINQVVDMQDYRGLIIYSLKQGSFIMGADILEFADYTALELDKLLEFGQNVLQKLSKLDNTVCCINGLCLGGGLELALACNYRIATISSKLGLPEVTLGIIPGWGGTVRLPKLIGQASSLEMMLSGRTQSAKNAKRLGLIDDIVVPRQLNNAGKWFLQHKPKSSSPRGVIQRLLKLKILRRAYAFFVLRQLKQKVQRKHYPAPYALLQKWVIASGNEDISYQQERTAFLQLVNRGEAAKNLFRVYQLQQMLKKQATSSIEHLQHVHVVGAGVMGAEIAIWCALKGFKTTVSDTNLQALANVKKHAASIFKKKLAKGHERTAAYDRLILDWQSTGLAKADIIIEAVSEKLAIKHAVWQQIDVAAKPAAIFATNTSSLLVEEIAKVIKQPSRLIGVHFFNPVSKMPLVELVYSKYNTTEQFTAVTSFIKSLSKLPLWVKSTPGFLVNRILMPYMLEALVMLNEYTKEEIDTAARSFGMPMGPLELADKVGLDICREVGKSLEQVIKVKLPTVIDELIAEGKLGVKTGAGLYNYQHGKPVRRSVNLSTTKQSIIMKRLHDKMLKEAKLCLEEGVVTNSDMLDAGMIFATGFAPFRGGLLFDNYGSYI